MLVHFANTEHIYFYVHSFSFGKRFFSKRKGMHLRVVGEAEPISIVEE